MSASLFIYSEMFESTARLYSIALKGPGAILRRTWDYNMGVYNLQY
jgi:hypothetical protein